MNKKVNEIIWSSLGCSHVVQFLLTVGLLLATNLSLAFPFTLHLLHMDILHKIKQNKRCKVKFQSIFFSTASFQCCHYKYFILVSSQPIMINYILYILTLCTMSIRNSGMFEASSKCRKHQGAQGFGEGLHTHKNTARPHYYITHES